MVHRRVARLKGDSTDPAWADSVRRRRLIIAALDANHDGVIDADEIANASAELKTLDKNGDGKLTPDEFIGKRPQGRPPGGGDAGVNSDGPKGPPPGEN